MSTSAVSASASPDRERRQAAWHLRRLRMLGLLLVCCCVLWQFASTFVLDRRTAVLLPPPSAVSEGVLGAAFSPASLLIHLRDSLQPRVRRLLWALSAVPLGIAMGWSKAIDEQVDPLIEVLRPVPPWRGSRCRSSGSASATSRTSSSFSSACSSRSCSTRITGVKNIEPNLIRAARCLGASESRILRRVVLRAALPQIITGVRIGLGVGWMALVAAELVGANSGLGFLINDARTLLRTDIVIVGMITIGMVGLIIDRSIRLLGRRLMPWSRTFSA